MVQALKDSSYLVISSALEALSGIDSIKAYQAAEVLERDSSDEIIDALARVYGKMGGKEKNQFFLRQLRRSDVSYYTVVSYGAFVSRMVDQPSLVEDALTALYDLAQKDNRWYVRFAAMNSLENIYTAMDTQKEEWNNMLLQTEKEMKEWSELQSSLEWLTNQMTSLKQKISDIQATETDANLKMMYGSHN
jgi:hypothetical protein